MNPEITAMLKSLPAPKPKAAPIEISQRAKAMYFKAHDYWLSKQAPQAVKDHGLHKGKLPVIRNANGLATYCENVFNWSGYHLERTGNTGVFRGGKWTKGTGTNGTSDLKGVYKGRAIHIELKFKRDKQSKEQEKYQEKVTAAGAIYAVVKTPDDLFDFIEYLKTL